MELNQKQIKYLFKFVEEKGVKYYDVQHEIVDHLASSIETEMIENKNTSFEQALYRVYSKFPITGFAQYTVDLEKSLWSFWIKKIVSTIFIGYGLPVIGLLAALTFSFYYLINSIGEILTNTLYYGVHALGLLALMIFGRQFGKSVIEMMLYSEWIIFKDHLKERLLYYQVLKTVTIAIIITPLFLTRLSAVFVYDSSTNLITGDSSSILILSLFSSISIYWSLAVIFYFPRMVGKVIANKYNHVVIA